jgi:hypothetical protein
MRTRESPKNHVRGLDRDPNSPSLNSIHHPGPPPNTPDTPNTPITSDHPRPPPTTPLAHSDRKLFTGFATAARIACTHTVNSAIAIAPTPAAPNTHQWIAVR